MSQFQDRRFKVLNITIRLILTLVVLGSSFGAIPAPNQIAMAAEENADIQVEGPVSESSAAKDERSGVETESKWSNDLEAASASSDADREDAFEDQFTSDPVSDPVIREIDASPVR